MRSEKKVIRLVFMDTQCLTFAAHMSVIVVPASSIGESFV